MFSPEDSHGPHRAPVYMNSIKHRSSKCTTVAAATGQDPVICEQRSLFSFRNLRPAVVEVFKLPLKMSVPEVRLLFLTAKA